MSDAETIALAEQLRERAQAAYRHALNAEPPRRMSDEDLTTYRIRLLEPIKSASKDWGRFGRSDFRGLANAGGLSIAETQIYADAVRSIQQSRHGLRTVSEPDQAGRPITKFYGDPEEVWGAFKAPAVCARLNRTPRAR